MYMLSGTLYTRYLAMLYTRYLVMLSIMLSYICYQLDIYSRAWYETSDEKSKYICKKADMNKSEVSYRDIYPKHIENILLKSEVFFHIYYIIILQITLPLTYPKTCHQKVKCSSILYIIYFWRLLHLELPENI